MCTTLGTSVLPTGPEAAAASPLHPKANELYSQRVFSMSSRPCDGMGSVDPEDWSDPSKTQGHFPRGETVSG